MERCADRSEAGRNHGGIEPHKDAYGEIAANLSVFLKIPHCGFCRDLNFARKLQISLKNEEFNIFRDPDRFRIDSDFSLFVVFRANSRSCVPGFPPGEPRKDTKHAVWRTR